jgi:hypothetical protein
MTRRDSIGADSSLRPSRTLARSESEGELWDQVNSPRLRVGLVCSFASLARQISGWTTNLLATAIVLAGGLAFGWQVLFWWHEQPQPAAGPSEAFLAAADLPPAAGREFWTKHGPLKVEQVRGGPDEAIVTMRASCRGIQPPQDSAAAGPGEVQFLAQLSRQAPLEEAGDLALYQPPGRLAMVVAVSRSRQRIVGWSFALSASDGTWTLYHFRPQSAGAVTGHATAQSAMPIAGGGP